MLLSVEEFFLARQSTNSCAARRFDMAASGLPPHRSGWPRSALFALKAPAPVQALEHSVATALEVSTGSDPTTVPLLFSTPSIGTNENSNKHMSQKPNIAC